MDTKQNHKTCYHIHSKNLYLMSINLGIKKKVFTDITTQPVHSQSLLCEVQAPLLPSRKHKEVSMVTRVTFGCARGERWQSADN